MAKIIPWTLPPVKGGSIGGYTEHGSGSGGDTPEAVQPFEFSKPESFALAVTFPQTTFTSSSFKSVEVNGYSYLTLVGGFTPIDLTGVASVRAIISNTWDLSSQAAEVTNCVLAFDPVTRSGTFVSCESFLYKYGGTTSSAWAVLTSQSNSGTIQFVAYNGNGEILQTSEVFDL